MKPHEPRKANRPQGEGAGCSRSTRERLPRVYAPTGSGEARPLGCVVPLTAADPEGRPIFPFAGGVNRARCRDPKCAAAMAAVHAVGDGPDPERVAHWRHIHRGGGAPSCWSQAAARGKGEWHLRWQAECAEAARVEVPTVRDGRRRVADVVTPFGWAVEFQSSPIGRADYQGRTDHYRGRVVWVFDTCEERGGSLHLDPGGRLEWLDKRTANRQGRYRDGLIFLDAGDGLWMLPADGRGVTAGSDGYLRVHRGLCPWWTRERFAAAWINGPHLPLAEPVGTPWEAAEAARRAAAPKPARPQQSRRRAADTWQCWYTGDRSALVVDRSPAAPAEPAEPRRCAGYFCASDAAPGGPFCAACDARGAEAAAMFTWGRP